MGFDFLFVDARHGVELAGEHFHVNVAGMAFLRRIMRACALFDEATPAPEEAPFPPAGLTFERALDVDAFVEAGRIPAVPVSSEELAIHANWAAEELGIAGYRSPEPDKVPASKFARNDNWHVTVQECALIADRLSRALLEWAQGTGPLAEAVESVPLLEPDLAPLVEEWVRFNREALAHGGYRVA